MATRYDGSMQQAITLKGHHLTGLQTYLYSNHNSFLLSTAFTIPLYGMNRWSMIADMFDSIRKNPDLKIQVVAGKEDDICNSCKRKKVCISLFARETDIETIKDFGLEENATYLANELVRVLKNGRYL